MSTLSTMESDSPDLPGMPPVDELDALNRTASDVSITALPVPLWVWPTVAVIGSGYALGWALGDVAWVILTAASLFSMLAIARILASRAGVFPDPRKQPGRLKWLQARWLVETIVLVLAMMALGLWVNKWLAVVLSGPLFALISYLPDERYEGATAKMRAAQTLT